MTERKTPVTVIHVCDKLSVGDSGIHGVARLFQWWFPLLAAAGYRPLLCVLRGRDRAGEFLESCGLTIEYLGRSKFDPRTLSDLARIVRQHDARLIHLHGYGAWTFGRIVARRLRLPAVLHEHIAEADVPRVQRISDRLLAGSEPVIAVSKAVAAFCERERGVRGENIVIIPNGIPLKELGRHSPEACEALAKALGVAGHRPLLGVVARLEERKGVEYAIRALPAIRAVHGDALLLIAGDGELRAPLEALASAQGVGDAVRFLGFREDVVGLMSLVDVLLIPSLTEGHPLTLLEAFATATAVVSSNAGGLGEVIDDGDNGLLVPPRNPQAMAEAALRLLGDRPLADRLAANARRTAETRYDMRAVVERLAEVYDDLLNGRTGAR